MWYYEDLKKSKANEVVGDCYEPYKNDARKADSHIKYCNSCKRCWEVDETKSNGSYYRKNGIRLILFYEDFPLIGKEKEICEYCKK